MAHLHHHAMKFKVFKTPSIQAFNLKITSKDYWHPKQASNIKVRKQFIRESPRRNKGKKKKDTFIPLEIREENVSMKLAKDTLYKKEFLKNKEFLGNQNLAGKNEKFS